ncbi:MAG TPA: glycosyltransferase family 39 protein [Candidatus Paceibacterota bacterium]|nr:glycosyltransferase family 39 protein [Candidatus Paceibacterota bacterium]
MLITLFGFVLRVIAARNIGMNPDDSNHAIRAIGALGSEKLVDWGQSTILWFYIENVFYKIFGTTQFGSRFVSVLFGSLMIILMFLFVKKVFKSEKAALISSFLIAVSPMLIKGSLAEMDIIVSFFVLFGAYFMFSYLEHKSNKNLIFCALFVGVAIMIKIYALFFALVFMGFLIYKELKSKEEGKNKRIFKKIFLFGIIIFILVLPTLTHNYLLYKDKGFMDLIFTNTFKLGVDKAREFYEWDAGWMDTPQYGNFIFGGGFLRLVGHLFKGDPLLFIFGLFGLAFAFNKNRKYFLFFLLMFVPLFIYIGSREDYAMAKHLLWVFVIIAPVAGDFFNELLKKFKKIRLRYLFLIIALFSLFYLGVYDTTSQTHFYAQSSSGQLMSFKEKNIPDNALIVADSRIYRGRIHWELNGKKYIESAQFFNIVNELNTKGNLQSIDVYYIECVADDCGWGTVGGQPEFNKSMEEINLWFANRSFYSEEISEPDRRKSYFPIISEKEENYRIYKLNLMLNPEILSVVKQMQNWFLYPIGYDEKIAPIFDKYSTRGVDIAIDKFALLVLYFELIFSFFAIFYIAYLFLRQEQDKSEEKDEEQEET